MPNNPAQENKLEINGRVWYTIFYEIKYWSRALKVVIFAYYNKKEAVVNSKLNILLLWGQYIWSCFYDCF